MSRDVLLLTARRSYEFPADAIRLTVLSLPDVRSKITKEFGFEFSGIGTPFATFDQPAQTHPPGLAFDLGSIEVDGEVFSIRFLHVEARRVVIDVAAPSAVIDAVYGRLQETAADYRAPDGHPSIGSYDGVRDYSEYTATYGFGMEAFFNSNLRSVLKDVDALGDKERQLSLVPTVYLLPQSSQEPSIGSISQPLSTMFQFSVRAGTKPADRVYFSGAPIDSDRHRAMLELIDSALSSSHEI